MRKFYDPVKFFKNITDPAGIGINKDKPKAPAAAASSGSDKAAEDAKAAAAASAARATMAARTGSASTLLSPLEDVSNLTTKRRTLGSS